MPTPKPTQQTRRPRGRCLTPRQTRGGSRVVILVALVVLALVGGLTAVVLLRDQGTPADTHRGPDPDAEIASLQEEFKRYIENRLDMTDLLPSVAQFTRDYPDYPAGHILHAQVLMKLELYGEAYPELDKAVRKNPDNFELRKLTGTCAAKLGQWDEAERHLDAADKLREDVTVVLQLGNLYLQTGRLDAAAGAFERAKGLGGMTPPHKPNAGLAEVEAQRGDYERALTHINLAIRWAGGDSEAQPEVYRLKKARILMDAGRWDEGAALLLTTQRDYPDTVSTLAGARLRARLAAHRGEPALAAREYELLANPVFTPEGLTDRDRADLYAELAHWQLEAGNPARAREAVNVLRGLMPDHPMLGELDARLSVGEPNP